MKIKNNNSGFTLIECLISIVLLSIVLAGGIRFYFNSSGIIGLVSHTKLATEIANSKLEDLKRAGYASLPSAGPGVTTALTTTEDPARVLIDLGGSKTVTVTDKADPVGVPDPDYKQVDVKISWTEADTNTLRETQFTTYMAP
jgi:prepilin-type N-terminal cleavage/methylation domain-containing protein